MLDNYGYKLTLRICNSYCFSIATTVVRKRLNFTLYVHRLSRYVTISSRILVTKYDLLTLLSTSR
jgi:hypothetical protein